MRLADDEPSRLGRGPSQRAQCFIEPSRPDERGPNAGGNIIAVGLECVFRGVGTDDLDLVFQTLRLDLPTRSVAGRRANVDCEPGDAECRRPQDQGLTVAAAKVMTRPPSLIPATRPARRSFSGVVGFAISR